MCVSPLTARLAMEAETSDYNEFHEFHEIQMGMTLKLETNTARRAANAGHRIAFHCEMLAA